MNLTYRHQSLYIFRFFLNTQMPHDLCMVSVKSLQMRTCTLQELLSTVTNASIYFVSILFHVLICNVKQVTFPILRQAISSKICIAKSVPTKLAFSSYDRNLIKQLKFGGIKQSVSLFQYVKLPWRMFFLTNKTDE